MSNQFSWMLSESAATVQATLDDVKPTCRLLKIDDELCDSCRIKLEESVSTIRLMARSNESCLRSELGNIIVNYLVLLSEIRMWAAKSCCSSHRFLNLSFKKKKTTKAAAVFETELVGFMERLDPYTSQEKIIGMVQTDRISPHWLEELMNEDKEDGGATTGTVVKEAMRLSDIGKTVSDELGKLGRALKDLNHLDSASEVLRHAPYVGIIFATINPVLKSIQDSSDVEKMIGECLKRIQRLLEYANEMAIDSRQMWNALDDPTYQGLLLLTKKRMDEVVILHITRSKRNFVQNAWCAWDQSSKLSALDKDVDKFIHERTFVDTQITRQVVERMENRSTKDAEKKENWPPTNLPTTSSVVGRKEEMKTLDLTLSSRSGRIASLVGGAGVGKTHCARAFARQWYDADARNRFGWWFFAASEDALRRCYENFLTDCGEELDEHEKKHVETSVYANRVYEKMRRCPHEWIAVFDNLPEDSTPAEMQRLLPLGAGKECFGNGRVLFTTWSKLYSGKTCFGDITKIDVEPMETNDALAMLFQGKANIAYSEEHAGTELVGKLGKLPLAIAVASGHIRDREIAVIEYLEELNLNKVADSVEEVHHFSLAYMRDEGMGPILDIAAYVDPDTMTSELLGGDHDKIIRLCNANLLRRVGECIYSIHRFTQVVLRRHCHPTGAIYAVGRVLQSFDSDNTSTWDDGRAMQTHVDALDRNVSCFQSDEEKLVYAWSVLGQSSNVLDYVLNDAPAAEKMGAKALELLYQVYGCDAKNEALAHMLNLIGGALLQQRRFDAALEKFEQSLSMYQHIFGTDIKHDKLVSVLHNIGVIYDQRGDLNRAYENYDLALETHRHRAADCPRYGPDYSRSVFRISDELFIIGNIYFHHGDLDAAQFMYIESLAASHHVLGDDCFNVQVTGSLNSIGYTNMFLGDLEVALECCTKALAIQKHFFGDDAMTGDMACILDAIGNVHMRLGKIDDAKEYCYRALDMQLHLFGPDVMSCDVADTLQSIGDIHDICGDFDAAFGCYSKAMSMYRHNKRPGAPIWWEEQRLSDKIENLRRRQKERRISPVIAVCLYILVILYAASTKHLGKPNALHCV